MTIIKTYIGNHVTRNTLEYYQRYNTKRSYYSDD